MSISFNSFLVLLVPFFGLHCFFTLLDGLFSFLGCCSFLLLFSFASLESALLFPFPWLLFLLLFCFFLLYFLFFFSVLEKSKLLCAGNVPLGSSSWTINPILLCPWDLSDGLGREDFVEQALRAQGGNLKAKPTSVNGIWNLVELLFFEESSATHSSC